MDNHDFSHLDFGEREVAARLARAYRVLLERASRSRQHTSSEAQCSEVEAIADAEAYSLTNTQQTGD